MDSTSDCSNKRQDMWYVSQSQVKTARSKQPILDTSGFMGFLGPAACQVLRGEADAATFMLEESLVRSECYSDMSFPRFMLRKWRPSGLQQEHL